MEELEEIGDMGELIVQEKTKSDTEIGFDRNINYILKEWDVEFSMSQEVLYKLLDFVTEINTDFIIKFYENRIFIQVKSPDNLQYTEVNINSKAMTVYKPGLEGYQHLHYDIVVDSSGKEVIGERGEKYKAVIVDFRGFTENIKKVIEKDDIAEIRIDTLETGTGIMDIILSGGIRFWIQTIYCTLGHPTKKSMEKLPNIIKRIRHDPKVAKAKVEIEPSTFIKMCATFHWSGKQRDIDNRIFIKLGKNGLEVTSGDKLIGRLFQVRNIDTDTTDFTKISIEDFESKEEIESAIAKTENELNSYGSEKKKKTGNKDKKSKTGDNATDLLYRPEVDSDQIVYITSEYILPFLKLKGLSPILIEIRNDRPLILQQIPFQGIDVMFSIAPRIESEEIK